MPDQATTDRATQFVLFRAGSYRGALPLPTVQRVVRAVEVAPLPNAPPSVRGFIDVHGQIVPVMDLRVRLGLAARAIQPQDCLVLARTSGRPVALLVDGVDDVIALTQETAAFGKLLPDLPAIGGVSLLDDELILIHDLETFLSPTEAHLLDSALSALEAPPSHNATPT